MFTLQTLFRKNYLRIIGTAAVLVFLIALTLNIRARSNGSEWGKTSSTSQGCNCHASSANTATQVTVVSQSGSFSVATNGVLTLTVTVTNSSKQAAGVDIAVKTTQTGSTDAGTLEPVSGSGLQTTNGELTHTEPKAMSGGSASFQFTWTAPSSPGTYYLRAVGNAVNDNNSNDAGDIWNWMAVQQITVTQPPTITLTSPSGGENWCKGSQHNITWTAQNVTNVNIDLSSDGGSSFPTSLATSLPAASGSWQWTISNSLSFGNQYQVRVSDASNGSLNSKSNNFTLPQEVAITTQPQSQTGCTGNPVSFSVSASGTGLSYAWRKNGTNISGAINATYTISSIVAGDAGNYDCVVSGACGNPVTSNAASLSIDISPNITQQPESVLACLGETITLSVTAVGTELTYKWQKNGTDIPGAASSSLILNNFSSDNVGSYTSIVSGKCNPSRTSQAAVLTLATQFLITEQPAPVSVCEGSKATFSVKANGSNLLYQWRKDGSNITGANSSTFAINNSTPADQGQYDVIISGKCISETPTSTAMLTVLPKPSITQQPANQTVTAGTDVEFKITSLGTGLTYQWRKNNTNITGANTSSLKIISVKIVDAGNYDCVITNNCGNVNSSVATLTVNSAGTGPVLSSNISTVDFGLVLIGNSKDSLITQCFRNSGDAALNITAISITGANASEFSLSGVSLPLTLNAGESKSLTIKFMPTTQGMKTAKIEFASNSATNPSIMLNGFSGKVGINQSTTKLEFSNVNVGSSSDKNFELNNTGSIDLSLNFAIVGTDADQFSITGATNPVIISAGSKKDVTIRYTPKIGSVEAKAVLQISSMYLSTPLAIALEGKAISSVGDNLEIISGIETSPNPSDGNLVFNISTTHQNLSDLFITDMNGNVIKNFNDFYLNSGKNEIVWDGRDNEGKQCSSGIYNLIVRSGNSIKASKIVLSR
ncbi:MAG: Choice-of-anchor protein [Ignavibacteria bacterium]|nr:Choice-of-anchor protein [Ignavibacteria bacterium]